MSMFMKNDKMLRALNICGLVTRVWPLEDEVGRLQVISYKALAWFYLVNDFSMIPALVKGILYYQNDLGNMMKTILELMCVLEMITSIFYCIAQEKRFRRLLAELERADDKYSSPYEEILRRKFMFYVRVVYISSFILFFISAGAYIFSPLILPHRRDLPLNTIFPLAISETWVWYLIYAQNVLAILQVSLVEVIDVMIITILWNASFKFYLLGMQMRSVFIVAELRAVIDAHQNVLDYAQESGSIASFLIMKSVFIIFTNTISASLLILHNNMPFLEMVQFISIILLSLMRLYVVCLAAELMTDMAYEISWRIYDIPWMYATPNIRRVVCIIIQRCQKSLALKATSIVPMICVNFCGKVISAGFSYFLALRTILYERNI